MVIRARYVAAKIVVGFSCLASSLQLICRGDRQEGHVIQSMTGFASASGSHETFVWIWDIRSVNAKGRDLRLRVPDWIEGLEAQVRSLITPLVSRGAVSLSLRITREDAAIALVLNQPQLTNVLTAMETIETQAMDIGLALSPSNACDILALRGVLEGATELDDTGALKRAVLGSLPPVLDSLVLMRASEGRALYDIITKQIEAIAGLTAAAATHAETQKKQMAQTLQRNIEKALGGGWDLDEQRLAQEIATLVVKSDITEEIDRLGAHVSAAHALLEQSGPVGRKLDFLTQEFNREANTLCSKSHSVELTRVGLELKTIIDQIREQVQNVE